MATYQTKDISSNPPTLDEIRAAIKRNTVLASEDVKDFLFGFTQKTELEQFNFGPLDLDTIRDAQSDGLAFITAKHFQMPYPLTMYRSVVKYDNHDVGTTVFTLQASAVGDKDRLLHIRVVQTHEGVLLAMLCINTMETHMAPEGIAVEIQLPRFEVDFWKHRLGGEAEMNWQASEGSLLAVGMTMIVNTKGVLKQRTAPPAKPNKARAAKGLPLIPYVTRVYTSVYNQAVQSGTPGTHASPRPHIRRAHIRHYAATAQRAAYVRPIAAMLVNWDGTPLQPRQEYIVK